MITAKFGLLYRDGVILDLPEADDVALANGYQCAELMVRALEKKDAPLSDERLNLPSASSTERLAACPRSYLLSRGLPDRPSEDSTRGTRIHSAFAGESVELSPDEQDILESLQRMEIAALKQWEATLPNEAIASEPQVIREWRMWLHNGADKIFSGQPDVCYILGNHALILDAKTGRAAVSQSASNVQLRALAVLLHEQYPGLETITVAILAPLAQNE